ncbi:TonB-dependent receptor [Sphingomonas sp. So64.6b]|uniref:TonB-dependent receptor n=1 Tax=Sphingomonas sp. So64.6b TaxID=2997354 RepID=UPI0016006367|nr:TonB-dependent receptor [Sphingomonas sp. So64.6b]QNA85441.1 TonB-dependent receptor [Sphingomonas sp. So64.6b]
MTYRHRFWLLGATSLMMTPYSARAQVAPVATQDPASADVGDQLEDIVVTAQKRRQSVNDVPISITALDGGHLAEQGVRRSEDLARVVPGLSFTETQFDAPIFTLRGVGYNENSLAASPTVSVYVDEVPLPFPVMTRGGTLDLERVEVLKGPQGTLFGQNSTGGAINYVAAKPTAQFLAGGEATFGRFSTFDASAFVSGPLSDTVRARASVSTTQGGDWQRSTTRNDRLGSQDLLTGRLLLDWAPSSDVRFELNINGWRDKSDSAAAQLVGLFSANGSPLPASFTSAPIVLDPRAADWTPGLPLARDNDFVQASLRADWSLGKNITVTSITAYDRFRRNSLQDADGLQATDLHLRLGGRVQSFTQELRLAGTGSRFNWVVGGNYQRDRVHDLQQVFLEDSPASFIGPLQFRSIINDAQNAITTWAGFANAEYEIADRLTVQAGARYTRSSIDYRACTKDTGADDIAAIIRFVQGLVGAPMTAAAGQCVTLQPDFSAGDFVDSLDEDNLSWRAGVNFKPSAGALVYANVSRGYKAGSFPTLSAQSSTQLAPVTQEALMAYELGFKLPLAGNRVRLNGAAFFYDYRDKQLSGRIQTLFGQLQNLVNIPRSMVKGAELQLSWLPVRGLNVSAAGTYLQTRIRRNPDGTSFQNFDQFGSVVSLSGNAFPYSPKWQLSGDAQYDWHVSGQIDAFVGAAANYRSATKAALEDDARLAIDAYTLVDVRAGIKDADDRWRLSIYGRNIFNAYYWNNVLHIQDTIVRYTGRPAEYGVSVGFKF